MCEIDSTFAPHMRGHIGESPDPACGRAIPPPPADRLDLDARNRPGTVFDLELPLAEAAAGYEAMDERTATKVLLHP